MEHSGTLKATERETERETEQRERETAETRGMAEDPGDLEAFLSRDAGLSAGKLQAALEVRRRGDATVTTSRVRRQW